MTNQDRIPIVIDIETAPDAEWIERTADEFIAGLKPPANYKTPEAIGKWFEEQIAGRVSKAALSPIDGRITAFSIAPLWSDSTPWSEVALNGDGHGIGYERRLIVAMIADLNEMAAGKVPMLTGWRINGFDLPFITARAAVHSIALPDWWPDHPRRYGATLDGADILTDGRLNTWLSRFGLPLKTAGGADAPHMLPEDLLAYVTNDVVVERALLQRLAIVSPTIRSTRPESSTDQ